MTTLAIPTGIQDAATGLLSPYIPDFSIERMLKALNQLREAPEEPDRLLTRVEAANHLSVSIPTIDRLLASGALSRIKIRRSARISQKELQVYRNENMHVANNQPQTI